jgi:class 3 adenylate cyclase
MGELDSDALVQGRDAYQSRDWQSAYQLLKDSDGSQPLAPGDLEQLSWAAYWTGRYGEAVDLFERAERGYTASGDSRATARMALHQARLHFEQRNASVASGLWARAAELLADEPECAEQGLLAWSAAAMALSTGSLEAAREQAERAIEIGRRTGDRDVEAMGRLWLGHVNLVEGRHAEGIALHDEATASATSGALGPFSSGAIYCSVIVACRNRADWGRAAEWTERADRWCERESVAFFPGLCRVHRAEVLRFRGVLQDAERDALAGRDLLLAASPRSVHFAYQELAEIRLRLGDIEGAEEACRQCLERGRDPQPALARLRLAQGDATGALAAIERALADPTEAQATLLPAKVSIALAAGAEEAAREALTQLEGLAAELGTPAPLAAAAGARGELELSEGRSESAIAHLRRARTDWSEVEAPYEAGRAQYLLACAYEREGDLGAARMELESALASFERLGARLDAVRAREHLARLTAKRSDESPATRLTKTFMFTDIVDSTKLVELLGDASWDKLQRWHHRTLRSCFEAHDGEEVSHEGDGFFITFSAADAALDCAIAIQRALASHRTEHGFAPQIRIGLHTAEALQRGTDYAGKGVHTAARIAGAGGADEILASRAVVAAASGRFSCADERQVELKGLASPIAVMRVHW